MEGHICCGSISSLVLILSLCFKTHYHTLPYLKTKGNKLNHNIYNPRISLVFWATELDMSTGLDKQIELRKPSSIRVYRSRSSRPVDMSTLINPYRARFPELDLFIEAGWHIELEKLVSSSVAQKTKLILTLTLTLGNATTFLHRPRNVLLGLILPMTGVKMARQTHFLYLLLRLSFFQGSMLNTQGPGSHGAGWRVEPPPTTSPGFF